MKFLSIIFGFIFLLITTSSYAVVIAPNTIISSNTTYSGEPLDMTGGNFIVQKNAVLTITNCTITGTLSATNPNLIDVQSGSLVMSGTSADINAIGITEHPEDQSIYYMVQLESANVDLTSNSFTVEEPFSVGFLITSVTIPTDNITISNNSFTNWHGVLYLLNSENSVIDSNLFVVNSYGNIVLIGNNSIINNNKIHFSGRDRLGNAMDIIDSDNITITDNVLFTSTCRGIYVLLGQDIVIDGNSITGGITYAMIIVSVPDLKDKDNYAMRILNKSGKRKMVHMQSSDITITNNVMSQNRYGITATDVMNLNVSSNYFSQRFVDAPSRQFWTDNNVLLNNISNLGWTNNLYKEAFTQVNGGDNSQDQFVTFPVTGGVVL